MSLDIEAGLELRQSLALQSAHIHAVNTPAPRWPQHAKGASRNLRRAPQGNERARRCQRRKRAHLARHFRRLECAMERLQLQ